MSIRASLAVSCVVLSGCLTSPVGDYRVDASHAFAASCTGATDAQRGQVWTSAMLDGVIDDLHVTRGGGIPAGDPEVQLGRSSDGSRFWSDVEETSEFAFHGERIAEATTIEEAQLGTDFSALLEAGALGCVFDLDVLVDLEFRDEAWEAVDGSAIVTVAQTAAVSDERCELGSCMVEYRFAAAHTSGTGRDRVQDEDAE